MSRVAIVIFLFSRISLLLYVCLLRPIIVMCALDMLLIKATYLLIYFIWLVFSL